MCVGRGGGRAEQLGVCGLCVCWRCVCQRRSCAHGWGGRCCGAAGCLARAIRFWRGCASRRRFVTYVGRGGCLTDVLSAVACCTFRTRGTRGRQECGVHTLLAIICTVNCSRGCGSRHNAGERYQLSSLAHACCLEGCLGPHHIQVNTHDLQKLHRRRRPTVPVRPQCLQQSPWQLPRSCRALI